ncbi:MAG: trigger factor family protein, partial [Firmicutes bacterium]|nr:trigger factor family protein [Bacillota bacterium]
MEVRNLIENEKSEVSFEILCEGSEWAAYLKKAAAQFQKQKPVPGYRAGKAALPVAAKFYGKALFEAASREATNELMGQVLVEHNFTPVTYPSFIVITSDLSKLEFICRFVNYPTLNELKYKGLEAEKPVRHATD